MPCQVLLKSAWQQNLRTVHGAQSAQTAQTAQTSIPNEIVEVVACRFTRPSKADMTIKGSLLQGWLFWQHGT